MFLTNTCLRTETGKKKAQGENRITFTSRKRNFHKIDIPVYATNLCTILEYAGYPEGFYFFLFSPLCGSTLFEEKEERKPFVSG